MYSNYLTYLIELMVKFLNEKFESRFFQHSLGVEFNSSSHVKNNISMWIEKLDWKNSNQLKWTLCQILYRDKNNTSIHFSIMGQSNFSKNSSTVSAPLKCYTINIFDTNSRLTSKLSLKSTFEKFEKKNFKWLTISQIEDSSAPCN